MDRQTVYAGQVPLETDLLNTNRNVLVALGKVFGDLLGTSTVATGLGCVPTSPASLSVQVQPGQLYALQNLDNTAYSSLAADTTHQLVKQGILLDTKTFACTAPTTAGYSTNYLIEANYADVDTNAVVLAYYNATNPSQAFSGPGNNGQPSMTTRAGQVVLTLKPGVAAATGSQVTPAVDSGCIGLWVVTVAYGQATITAANISQYTGSPILPTSLLQSLITNNLEYGIDSGAANTVQATFPLPPTAVADNQQFWVKIKSANTGATTFTPNPGVIAPAPVVGAAHQALQGNELVANGRGLFVYRADIASYVLESCTGASLQTGAATASQHAVQFGQVAGIVGSARNLKCNNAAAGTSLTFTADEIVAESALGGLRYCLANFNATVASGTTGLGGIDTGTALAANSYYAVYAAIKSDGTKGAFLQLEPAGGAPSVYGGANLPANVVATALISVWPTNGSGQFFAGFQTDRTLSCYTSTQGQALNSSTTQSSPTALSISSLVPKSAKYVSGNLQMGSTASSTQNLGVYPTSGGFGTQGNLFAAAGSSASISQPYNRLQISTPQTIYYTATNNAGTPSFQIFVTSYEI